MAAAGPVDNAWGRQGWTTVQLMLISTDELAGALELAWRHALPKAGAKPKPRSRI